MKLECAPPVGQDHAAVLTGVRALRSSNWAGPVISQGLPRPLVEAFFSWLVAQAARVSRESDLGAALAYMLRHQDGFRFFLDNGRVDMGSNLVEKTL